MASAFTRPGKSFHASRSCSASAVRLLRVSLSSPPLLLKNLHIFSFFIFQSLHLLSSRKRNSAGKIFPYFLSFFKQTLFICFRADDFLNFFPITLSLKFNQVRKFHFSKFLVVTSLAEKNLKEEKEKYSSRGDFVGYCKHLMNDYCYVVLYKNDFLL